MSIKKTHLKKLERELDKCGIKVQSIKDAAEKFEITKAMIRLVLQGEKKDRHGIIEYFTDCVIKKKELNEKMLAKINSL